MAIDNCHYSFKQLAESVLPKHYKELELAMMSATKAEILVGHKSLTKKLLQALDRRGDFPGCYVLFIERSLNTWVFLEVCLSVLCSI